MFSEILDKSSEAYSMINAMCNPGSTSSSQFWDCTKAPNTLANCIFTVDTLSYSLTFQMWSSGGFPMCNMVAVQ